MQEEDEDEDDEVVQSPKVQKVQQNGVSPKQSKKQVQESPVAKQKTPKPNKQQSNAKNAEKTPNAKSVKKEKQSPKQAKGLQAEATPKQQKGSQAETSPKQQKQRTLEGGVIVEDLKVGTGEIAKPGRMVQVYYEGRLKSNNKVFDSARVGPGFKFRLGRQEVIKAWDVGVAGMKVGGKRKVICPPNMA